MMFVKVSAISVTFTFLIQSLSESIELKNAVHSSMNTSCNATSQDPNDVKKTWLSYGSWSYK